MCLTRGLCSLNTAIKLLCADEIPVLRNSIKLDNGTFLSDEALPEKSKEIYEKAIKAIKSGKLSAKEIKDSSPSQEVLMKTISKDQKKEEPFLTIYPESYQVLVFMKDFLQWALIDGIPISKKMLQFLRLANPLTDTPNSKHMVLQATAQVVWHYEEISIAKLENHWAIKKILTTSYSSKNTFRQIVKIVDPRPISRRAKQRKEASAGKLPYPPVPIPNISLINENGMVQDLISLRTVCKVLFNALKLLAPNLQPNELKQHPLIELYLEKSTELIKDLSSDWLTEVELFFPLSIEDLQ
jgi:hypothetical protein